MAKQKSQNKKNSFKEQLKLYLSSLSSRLNNYIYFNIPGVEDSVVITNGDYELLTIYSASSLSIHLLSFKNQEFIDKLKSILQIPSNIPYCIKSNFIRKAIKDSELEDYTVVFNDKKDLILQNTITNEILNVEVDRQKNDEDSTEEDSTEDTSSDDEENNTINNNEIEKDKLCGYCVSDVYALKVLEEECNVLKDYSEEYFKSLNKKYLIYDYTSIKTKPYLTNIYKTENITADMLDLKIPNMNECYVLFIDGQDIVSIKEFVKKTKGECKQYIWSENGTTIKNMAIYEDDELVVKSCRPFNEIIPISKQHVIKL